MWSSNRKLGILYDVFVNTCKFITITYSYTHGLNIPCFVNKNQPSTPVGLAYNYRLNGRQLFDFLQVVFRYNRREKILGLDLIKKNFLAKVSSCGRL